MSPYTGPEPTLAALNAHAGWLWASYAALRPFGGGPTRAAPRKARCWCASRCIAFAAALYCLRRTSGITHTAIMERLAERACSIASGANAGVGAGVGIALGLRDERALTARDALGQGPACVAHIQKHTLRLALPSKRRAEYSTMQIVVSWPVRSTIFDVGSDDYAKLARRCG